MPVNHIIKTKIPEFSMVEVFKTNIQKQTHATKLLTVLSEQFPLFKINFDLNDCDKILRVEGENVSNEKIIELITKKGYQCYVLE